MSRFPREELVEAFARYNKARIKAQETNDWTDWSNCFTEDAHYIERAYGEFHGREAIHNWITEVMAPFPEMTFPQDWVAFDDEQAGIVFQCQNRLPHPTEPDGPPFQFPTWTRLVYAGNGLFSCEEDCYNPVKDANPVIKAWIEAGGQFASRELVKMKHHGH